MNLNHKKNLKGLSNQQVKQNKHFQLNQWTHQAVKILGRFQLTEQLLSQYYLRLLLGLKVMVSFDKYQQKMNHLNLLYIEAQSSQSLSKNRYYKIYILSSHIFLLAKNIRYCLMYNYKIYFEKFKRHSNQDFNVFQLLHTRKYQGKYHSFVLL